MSWSFRFAAAIIAKCTDLVMKLHGGSEPESILSVSPGRFGPRHIHFGWLPTPRPNI